MKIVENIKAIRLAKQIKQQALAEALGLEITAISNIENGKRELRVNELDAIANALGVSVIDLLTYPDKYAPIENGSTGSTRKENPVKAILQIELSQEKRDQVFRLVFGDNDLQILNR